MSKSPSSGNETPKKSDSGNQSSSSSSFSSHSTSASTSSAVIPTDNPSSEHPMPEVVSRDLHPTRVFNPAEIVSRRLTDDLESHESSTDQSWRPPNPARQGTDDSDALEPGWRDWGAYVGRQLYPFVQPLIPKANFFWLHLAYFIFMGLLGGLILWALEDDLPYLDGLFVAASAVCVTGLSSVDFSAFSASAQVVVMVWILSGGLVMVSMVPLLIRLIFAKYRHKFLRVIKNIDDYQELTTQAQRILQILLITISCYIVVVHAIAFIIMGAYLTADSSANAVLRANGVRDPWWWALFHTVSCFQNAGFALFSSSIIPFSNDQVISLTLAFCIMAGNTFFPIFLRFILWALKLTTCSTQLREDLQELLRNPRFYYYYLFPSRQTWILLAIWLVLTGAEFFLFFVEWDRVVVYGSHFSSGIKLMINFVQTVSVRACGINNVNVGSLNFGHLAFLIVSMYISAFPYILTLRSSSATPDKRLSTPGEHVSRTTRNLIARDLVWLYFVVVLITLIEFGRPSTDPAIVPNSFLNICFEVSSAFGPVGLSTGFPGENYSYSGSFYGVSKFLIILTMLAGRHRGLPALFDSTISVAGELERKSRTFSLDLARSSRLQKNNYDDRMIIEDTGSPIR